MSSKAKGAGSKSLFTKALHKVSGKKKSPVQFSAKTGIELPCVEIQRLGRYVYSSQSGPDGGVTALPLHPPTADATSAEETSSAAPAAATSSTNHVAVSAAAEEAERRLHGVSGVDDCELEIAGLPAYCWTQLKHSSAYGLATSLYDCNPVTHVTSGDPVADVFGICARDNNAILALADGVNWGERAAVAARSAVYGCLEYLNRELFNDDAHIENTHDLFSCLLSSLDAAQRKIVEQQGFLTTLCVAVVCPIKASHKYVVCVVNVGDSYAFVYSRKHGVREITEGSHDLHSDRDLRNPGGALGPVDGHCPDLSNMTCSMTYVKDTDILFLASDGITDNFDPVVDHIALAKSEIEKQRGDVEASEDNKRKEKSSSQKRKAVAAAGVGSGPVVPDLPILNAYERHSSSLKAMEAVVLMFETLRENPCTAQELCADLAQHVLKLTDPRRKVLEDPRLHPVAPPPPPPADLGDTPADAPAQPAAPELTRKERRKRDKKVRERMLRMPGKLDHASIVAYEVGPHEVPSDVRRQFDLSLSCMQSRLQRNTIRRSYRNATTGEDGEDSAGGGEKVVAYETGL